MSNPLALVYRGPASKPAGCAEAVAALLQSAPQGFEVRYIGPRERLPLSDEALASATVYAQPGGPTLKYAYRKMRRHRDRIRNYVADGGRYLGFCLGAYLAGATPGFGLLPGDTDQYIATPSATVSTEDDTIVEVDWLGRRRYLYFQDGAVLQLDPSAGNARDASVLARYPNGQIAALAAPFGAGRIALVGPHPEATVDWYTDSGVVDPDGLDADLGHELVAAVMAVPIPGGGQ